MGFLEVIHRGNVKRIKELDALGQRADAIVKLFNDNGVRISENLVKVVLNGEMDAFDTKAVPKAAVRKVKAEVAELANGITQG